MEINQNDLEKNNIKLYLEASLNKGVEIIETKIIKESHIEKVLYCN